MDPLRDRPAFNFPENLAVNEQISSQSLTSLTTAPIKRGCFSNKDQPQSDSVFTSLLLIVTGGMNISWGFGFSASSVTTTTYMRSCWFVAAIVGSFMSAFLNRRLSKKVLLLVSALLVIFGGMLFVAYPSDNAAIITARHLNGFAVGFAIVTALVMCGEELTYSRRGKTTSLIDSVSFSIGAGIQIVCVGFWSSDSINVNQMHGAVCVLFGAISMFFSFHKVIESPVFLLLRGEEQEAVDSLRCLQPFAINTKTYQLLDEHMLYVAENREKTLKECIKESLPALTKLSLYRGMVAMSSSLIVNINVVTLTMYLEDAFGNWPFGIYGLVRYAGTLIGAYMMDTLGRKKPPIFSMIICGCVAIVIGYKFPHADDSLIKVNAMKRLLVLALLYQFFAGLAATSSSAYLSEAFPLTIKPFCIAITFAVEMLVHIIIGSLYVEFSSIAVYFCALGTLSLVFSAFATLCLPETRNTTLRQAQEKFKGFLSIS